VGDEKLIIISVAVGGINDIFVDNEHTHNQDSFFGGSPHKTGADCSIWTTMLSVQNEKQNLNYTRNTNEIRGKLISSSQRTHSKQKSASSSSNLSVN